MAVLEALKDARSPAADVLFRFSASGRVGSPKVSAEKYRRHASECLKLLGAIRDPGHRSVLLKMASAWTDLAQNAEKNARSEVRASVVLQQQQPQEKADEDEV
jgi:hypothetical protein